MEHCEALIVGAGLSGLQLAHELHQLGVDGIVALDAGPAEQTRHLNAALPGDAALRAWLSPATDPTFVRPWRSLTPPHFAGLSGLRQRVGGRSLYWSGVLLPLEPWALVSSWWPEPLVTDLTVAWQGGPSLYRRVAEDLAHWRGGAPDSLTVAAQAEHQALGIALRETPRAIRAFADGRWCAYSPLDHWRDPRTGNHLELPKSMRILPRQKAERILVRGGRAVGIIARSPSGVATTIAARVVVLAAAPVESARLALQAGLGGPSRRLTVVDHVVSGLLVRLSPQRAAAFAGRWPEPNCFAPCAEARSNLFFAASPLPDGGRLLDLQLMGEQLPCASSYVALDDPAADTACAVVDAMLSPADAQMIEAQQRIMADLWDRLADALALARSALDYAPYDKPARTAAALLEDLPVDQPATWTNQLGTEDHEGCTLPLGAILDHAHQARDLPGLFVAGAAAMPRLGAANPAMTILATTKRMAPFVAAAL